MFESHPNPTIWVFIGKLFLSAIRGAPISLSFCTFFSFDQISMHLAAHRLNMLDPFDHSQLPTSKVEIDNIREKY